MKLRRYTLWLLVSLAVLLLLVLMGLVLFAFLPTTSDLTKPKLAVVTFAGYSNAPDGGVFAWFSITNPTDSRIMCSPLTLEGITLEGQIHTSNFAMQTVILPPHTSVAANVTKPVRTKSWQVTFLSGAVPPGPKMFLARACQWLPFTSSGMRNWMNENSSAHLYRCCSEPRTD